MISNCSGHIRLVAELADLFASEVAITFKVMPFKIVDVDAAVLVGVAGQFENLAFDAGLVGIKPRRFRLKERGLVILVFLALHGIGGADESFQPKPLKILRKETGEVAPFGIVARQQHRLVAKGIRVVLQIGIHLLLDVGILRVELIVLRR